MGLPKPTYETKNAGDEKDPLYISDVVVGEEVVATGQGPTRREAERVAAELALEALKARYGEPQGNKRKKRKNHEEPAPASAPSVPLIPELLVESLRVAHQRGVKGPDAAEQVVRLAAEIYRGLIEEAGIVE